MKTNMGRRWVTVWLGVACLWLASPVTVAAAEPKPPVLPMPRNQMTHDDRVLSVAYSPDGKILASGSGDHTIKLWDVKTGKEQATLKGHTGQVDSVAYSPDGQMLASGSDDKTIKLWDVGTGK